MNKNIYKEYAPRFMNQGYSVIPDRYMSKLPAIKAWSTYCERMPTKEEVNSWSANFNESNIALAMDEASNIIAVDVDVVT